MYELVYNYTFPNNSIEPYTFPQEFYAYIQQNYSDDRIYQEKSFSDDGLTLNTRAVWVSREAFERYTSDATVVGFLSTKKQYNLDNGITWSFEGREIDSL
jgi:hypothetical protein